MQYTKNLQLSKPSYDDDVDIQVLNNNMDILDNEVNANTRRLNTHNNDINAHPLITNQIKSILGSTNWQDTPASTLVTITRLLGEGAIVSSNLSKNGYVKFANGFVIQWGLSWFEGTRTQCVVTLPTPCNVFTVVCSDDLSSTNRPYGDEFFISWNSGFSDNNRTSIRFLVNRDDGAGNFAWICIGKA